MEPSKRLFSLRRCILFSLFFFVVCFGASRSQTPIQNMLGVGVEIRSDSYADMDRVIEQAARIGVKRLRAVISWAAVEPERGRFSFDAYDHFVQSARKHGMEIVFSLGFCPKWAAGEDADESPEVRMRMMPRSLADWNHYVTTTVLRYRNEVRTWQVWEHPSIENFRGTTEDYFRLLVTAHAAAKKVEPDALIVASEPGGPDLGFISRLFGKSVIRSFEGLAVSPQVDWPEQLAEYLDAVHQMQTEHPDAPKRVFIADWGYFDSNLAERAYAVAVSARVDVLFWRGLQGLRDFHPSQEPVPATFLSDSIQGPVCVKFLLDKDLEEGLYTRKYRDRRMANPFATLQNGVPAAQLSETNPLLYFDVDDRYIFFNRGKSKIEILVTASARDFKREAGFNLMYDSPGGYVFSPWTSIQPGAWGDYRITLSKANFANKGGFDFRLNALGSRQDIYVSRVCVRRLPNAEGDGQEFSFQFQK